MPSNTYIAISHAMVAAATGFSVKIRDACEAVLSILQQDKLVRADADLAYETERLHALVDGLALHAMTASAKDLRPKAILSVLRAHLASLEPRRR